MIFVSVSIFFSPKKWLSLSAFIFLCCFYTDTSWVYLYLRRPRSAHSVLFYIPKIEKNKKEKKINVKHMCCKPAKFCQHYAMIIASGASIPLTRVYNSRLCNHDNKKFCYCFLAPFIAILCLSLIKSVLVQWLSAFWMTLHSKKRQVRVSGNWATLVMCQKD